jgi:hypothetical protein
MKVLRVKAVKIEATVLVRFIFNSLLVVLGLAAGNLGGVIEVYTNAASTMFTSTLRRNHRILNDA